MHIIKGNVYTNSSEDEFGRVKVKSGTWDSKCLVSVVGNIPLNKDDIVYIDVS